MLDIDPEALSNTRHSPYRATFERGYRWLRFDRALESEFQPFYTQAHLLHVRLAGCVGIVMFGLFVLIDIATLPAEVWVWTAGIRAGLIVPAIAITVLFSYPAAWRPYLQWAVFVTSLVTGLATVAIDAVLFQADQIPYEGILLVALFTYLIVCLQWRKAVLANLVTLIAFVVVELLYQRDAQARLYQIIYLCAANAVGAYGGYVLEYGTRTKFLMYALLSELAERDGLTGLYNRLALNTHLDMVWRQALRDERAIAVAMVDVDYFKRYNDRYGHAEGDAALKAVAEVIANQARRPLDMATRYGGEEFAVVWYQPAVTELSGMGEQMREAVLALGIAHENSEIGTLSVSVGIAVMRPTAGQTSADLLHAADSALYQAKEQGRNRVVVIDLPTAEALAAAAAANDTR